MKILDGLVPATTGEVLLKGQPISGPGPERAFVFQHFNLFAWRTVRRNVEFGLEMQGVPARERAERARHYIKMVGLEGFEDSLPHQLSGGMQQRVGLARALAVNPEILLMDEPFGALDAQTRVILQEQLLKIWSENRKTVVFVTHDIEEALYLSDRILIMSPRPGQIIDEVRVPLERPRTDHTRSIPIFGELRESIWQRLRNLQVEAIPV